MDGAKLTRRSFLKSAALAGAVAALGAGTSDNFVEAYAADSSSSGEEKVVCTACRACISNCAVKVTVRDGRVVRVVGDPIDPMSKGRICAKGYTTRIV
jgi:anaerobic selenocysteine-containing dehydrogenase